MLRGLCLKYYMPSGSCSACLFLPNSFATCNGASGYVARCLGLFFQINSSGTTSTKGGERKYVETGQEQGFCPGFQRCLSNIAISNFLAIQI